MSSTVTSKIIGVREAFKMLIILVWSMTKSDKTRNDK